MWRLWMPHGVSFALRCALPHGRQETPKRLSEYNRRKTAPLAASQVILIVSVGTSLSLVAYQKMPSAISQGKDLLRCRTLMCVNRCVRRAPPMGTNDSRLAKETNEMSDPIYVDFSFPFRNEAPPDPLAPKPRNGIVVRWGDRDEFYPDSDEITNDE
jgi:hypothetical protein